MPEECLSKQKLSRGPCYTALHVLNPPIADRQASNSEALSWHDTAISHRIRLSIKKVTTVDRAKSHQGHTTSTGIETSDAPCL